MINQYSEMIKYSDEEWHFIPKFEGLYEISNYGRIKSLQRKGKKNTHIMRERKDNYGYITGNICNKGNSYAFRCHRLVGLLFIPNPNNYPEINHLDGNKSNCYYKNLEWGTDSSNHKHAYLMGLQTIPSTKLNKENVIEIYTSSLSPKELANKYGVCSRTINHIKAGDTWTHITNNIFYDKYGEGNNILFR